MTNTDLLILADRVEGLSGPCRETDALIWWHANRRAFTVTYWNGALGLPRELETMPSLTGIGGQGVLISAPRYTHSLDAAMALVPEGWAFLLDWGKYGNETSIFWEVFLQRQDDAVSRGSAEASTPALALTAACLRTIAANQENPDG